MRFKKILLSSAAAALLATAAQADETFPVYVSLFGGASFLNDVDFLGSTGTPLPLYINHNNMGYVLGGAVGVDVSKSLRAELEVSHSDWGINSLDNTGNNTSPPTTGDYSSTFLMGNLWYDFHSNSVFTPYIGGGIGVAFPHQNLNVKTDTSSSDTPSAFAFQIGVGAKMQLSGNIDLDIGYRFKDVPDFTLNLTDYSGTYAYYNYSLVSHNIQAGLTFHF